MRFSGGAAAEFGEECFRCPVLFGPKSLRRGADAFGVGGDAVAGPVSRRRGFRSTDSIRVEGGLRFRPWMMP